MHEDTQSVPSDDDLLRIVESPTFDAASALASAQQVSGVSPNGYASFVAFMAHAEFFGRSGALEEERAAVKSYEKAIELQPELRLFPANYHLERLIGVGGFAYVFKVSSGGFSLALKVFKARVALPPVTRQLFAKALSKLGTCACPSILRVIDTSGLESKPAYYLMEYFEGEPMREWVKRRTFHVTPGSRLALDSTVLLVDILIQIAEALGAAHRADVLHLDLKPENILIGKDGSHLQVKVLDFNSLTVEHAGLPLQSLGLTQKTRELRTDDASFSLVS